MAGLTTIGSIPVLFVYFPFFSFLFQRLRKFLGQSSSQKRGFCKKAACSLHLDCATFAKNRCNSGWKLFWILPSWLLLLERERCTVRTVNTWCPGKSLHEWPSLTQAGVSSGTTGHRRLLRAGLAEQPPVDATRVARGHKEQRDWQRGGEEGLGKKCNQVIKCWLQLLLQKKLEMMANTCFWQDLQLQKPVLILQGESKGVWTSGFVQDVGFTSVF